MNCICILCHKPNNAWFTFLSQFTSYDIYVIIDDNSKYYAPIYKQFRNINVIQITNQACEKYGFVDMCFTLNKKITGWEKASYYFSVVNKKYGNVWFLEDDVFVHSELTLRNLDLKYKNVDLLSNSCSENSTGDKSYWHWNIIDIKLPPPYYSAMVCCIRVSTALLARVKEYASNNNTLFFSEALFPTLCKTYQLKYETPLEFSPIEYRKDFKEDEFDRCKLFHPVKDISKHAYLRVVINKK